MKIKDTPKVDRPQEKLIKYGPQKLTDAELLAIILRTGFSGANVVELSRKIIKKYGNRFGEISVKELEGIKGLGKTKSAQIIATFELAKRFNKTNEKQEILSPKDIFNSLTDLRNSKKEQLIAIYLDTRNCEIKREIISVGTLNANLVHPREVFEPAIRCLAAGIIIVHNHPSGDVNPSDDDIGLTKRINHAGKIMGIKILDHIIIAKNNWKSLNESNMID